jgi:hypothetical protein
MKGRFRIRINLKSWIQFGMKAGIRYMVHQLSGKWYYRTAGHLFTACTSISTFSQARQNPDRVNCAVILLLSGRFYRGVPSYPPLTMRFHSLPWTNPSLLPCTLQFKKWFFVEIFYSLLFITIIIIIGQLSCFEKPVLFCLVLKLFNR